MNYNRLAVLGGGTSVVFVIAMIANELTTGLATMEEGAYGRPEPLFVDGQALLGTAIVAMGIAVVAYLLQ